MEPTGGVTYRDLVGDPPMPRDAATTALVTPEVLDALFAAIAAGTAPVEAAVPLAEAFFDAYDRYFRKKVGPLPWVHHTLNGRVTAITGKTCTVVIASLPSPVTGVLYGPSKPAVNAVYPVRFPVALPPEGTPLAHGPVPAGQPWIKVPGGQTWLYYNGWTADETPAWYRVPLPPAGDPTFVYADTDALLVATKSARYPAYGDWGGEGLTGVTATHASRRLWFEDSFWAHDVNALKGAYGTVRPYRAQLRTYPEYGADPQHPAAEAAPPVLTSYPWLHLTGASLDPGATVDDVLGFQHAAELLAIPADNPGLATVKAWNERIEATSARGGAFWTARTTGCGFGHRNHFTYDDVNGYHAGYLVWDEGGLLDACAWVAEAGTSWGATGERISYWAINQLTPPPFPDPGERIPLSNPTLVRDRFNRCPARVHLWVARGDGAAQEVPLPGQPPGWVGAYPAFFLRPAGGTQARAWWAGMPSYRRTQRVPGGPIVEETTPVQLWRGDLDLEAGAGIWTIQGADRELNLPLAVNSDASIIAAAKSTPPSGSTPGTIVTYLSQDAGATWDRLPRPPHVVDWGAAQPRLRLIDLP